MEGLLVIIAVVISILNIMLFFKIWSMTNDVKKIEHKLNERTSINIEVETLRLKMLGRIEEAEKLLNAEMEKNLRSVCSNSKSIEDGAIEWNRSLKKMEDLYKYLGINMPEEYRKFDIIKLFETWNEM